MPVSDAELHARFRPLFDEIAAGAVERELHRRLPEKEIAALRDAGFGALRVPADRGGSGVTLRQLFALLVELAAADSNIPQALRTHLAFAELWQADPDDAVLRGRLEQIASGRLVGNAISERGGVVRDSSTTVLRRDGDRLLLDGEKFYCTGTLYADLVDVVALDPDGNRVTVLVETTAPGVERIDDWRGFGQKLTASGTTRFTGVEVDPAQVRPAPVDRHVPVRQAFLQLVQLAALAGIARRAADDVAAYVRDRKRNWPYGNADLPKDDPLVQQVVGKVDAVAFTVAATVDAAAASLDRALTEPEHADTAELDVYRAQSTVPQLVLDATSDLFEVGGASTVDVDRALDRHWRNARTLAVHNPIVYKQQVIGDHALNGTVPVLSLSSGVSG
ncbi:MULTISPECIES: acyl-CoA dehydrogenase family protein [unclassified Pseudonocardia]|uniref:acyl-CoA dehydrogenase family protein n=1 Tax=unclassified Pseudonocardia TaxID=2619320 RepID=UPI000314AE91|nr:MULTISPECIES: acyl-CoA dehydrogenase family protein [unclassified Pseudonocardia]ALE76039.1 acyl-CoA dehydrogenase [Pseudonocardia sp. EC080625-04]ALL78685.1 acyl-CoA dehydrogenase [Pseudonocardia sp. EC080610-09]ALL84890.1 acyl-CoA dehydrogenase [Pseudonocardia sp. EC080619-01]OLM19792.1 Acyl-CoA dehydrogenase, probable dibenzothiophene desulfurization enzyme [Pseudonocardia sp. Ae707_Ps1]